MILEKGDMWSIFGKTDVFIITTNPVIRKDGHVVMGAGIAKQMRDRFPDFAKKLGERIVEFKQSYDRDGRLLHMGKWDGQTCAAFMVKNHWAEPADLKLIGIAASILHGLASFDPHLRFDLNFPGIGNGKLARENVLPLLTDLPDNVHVWEYDS